MRDETKRGPIFIPHPSSLIPGSGGPMPWWRWRRRVPGVLFVVCLMLAAGLAGFVAVAPSLDGGGPSEEAAGKAVALFSRDVVVRRTSLGASVGLVATA